MNTFHLPMMKELKLNPLSSKCRQQAKPSLYSWKYDPLMAMDRCLQPSLPVGETHSMFLALGCWPHSQNIAFYPMRTYWAPACPTFFLFSTNLVIPTRVIWTVSKRWWYSEILFSITFRWGQYSDRLEKEVPMVENWWQISTPYLSFHMIIFFL